MEERYAACPHSPGLLWFRTLAPRSSPFCPPHPNAGQNKGPFGGNGREPEPAQREINLRGEDMVIASDTERRVRRR